MELIKLLTSITMDNGAPSPTIISTDTSLSLIFYGNTNNSDEQIKVIKERNTSHDQGVFVVKFKLYLSYRFGSPSNETISGHPYYKLGLRSYSCYLITESNWIEELVRVQSVHPYFNREKYKNYKHYIFTFHDNMFECIAQDYEVYYSHKSAYEEASLILKTVLQEYEL